MTESEVPKKSYVLTLVDTTGIQQYIFNSNTLKHIAGASGLVHFATHDWLDGALENLNVKGKTSADRTGSTIEKDDLSFEVIYQGGGNALILFRDLETAKGFAGKLSYSVLEKAPGLELVIVHEPLPEDVFQSGGVSVPELLQALFRKANQKKAGRRWSSPLPGLGVTAACPYTQKPAGMLLNGEWVSDEIYQKEVLGNKGAWDFFNNKFGKSLGSYEFVREFNQFSSDEKGSYMAVAHLDGTGMGRRLMDLIESHSASGARETLNALAEFSKSINDAVDRAMKAAISRLKQKTDAKVMDSPSGCLAFRPIVCDGDDITFVCDGRIGLTMSAMILKELSKNENGLSDGKGPIAGRAGVAIVKSHFPFSQAYTLAEDLNKNARNFARATMAEKSLQSVPMAMDWHISTSGTIGGLEAIREKYRRGQIELLMRPVVLGNVDTWRRWETIENLIGEFTSPAWEKKHSKLRGLEDVFFGGGDAIDKYLTDQNLDGLPLTPNLQAHGSKNGFIDSRSVYYDALEALDFYKFGTD